MCLQACLLCQHCGRAMSSVTKRALLLALVAVASSRLVTSVDVLQGCYLNNGNGTRPLPFLAMAGSTMGPALCSRMANARLAFAFGLEYGRECWLDPGRGSAADLTRLGTSTACDMPCAGDPSSTCGGPYAVNLYTSDSPTWYQTVAETNYQEVGCYRDSQEFRIMSSLLWDSNFMSLALCAHIAYSENWPVFGLQYGRECWGSDDIIRAEQLGILANDSCQVACSGNSLQTCGGSWAMQMYRFDAAPEIDTTHAGTTPADAGTHVDESDKPSTTNSPTPSLLVGDNSAATATETPSTAAPLPTPSEGAQPPASSVAPSAAPSTAPSTTPATAPSSAPSTPPQSGASASAVSSVLLTVATLIALAWI